MVPSGGQRKKGWLGKERQGVWEELPVKKDSPPGLGPPEGCRVRMGKRAKAGNPALSPADDPGLLTRTSHAHGFGVLNTPLSQSPLGSKASWATESNRGSFSER